MNFPTNDSPNVVIQSDNLEALSHFPDGVFQAIYIDPPFNTGKTVTLHESSYQDTYIDYWSFLEPRLEEAKRLLHETGTLYLHLDYREVHYAKVLLDAIFGRKNFLNEIIWAYDYGGRAKSRWPAKHDNILVYVKNRSMYHFDNTEVDREPYMAPGLVEPEKAAIGKLPTDVWWHTIVHTTGKERTGYPTQKPEGIVRRMVLASTQPGDWVLDYFAGSGTLGAVALKTNRRFVLIDSNSDAHKIMKDRLGDGTPDSPIEYHNRFSRNRVRASTRPEPNAPQR